jgi:uncharacterized protein
MIATPADILQTAMLISAGFVAGALNAVAGGGPLITLPVLMLTGLDARLANLTSTVALIPGQMATGYAARHSLQTTGTVPVPVLIGITAIGGATGAWLLLTTPSALFAGLVPYLVMLATALYAWSNFSVPHGDHPARIGRTAFIGFYTLISVYGGYFGGGNSFIMLAALALTGLSARAAGLLKNLLIALINIAAASVFIVSASVAYDKALPLGIGAIAGSLAGTALLHRVSERLLRVIVVVIGSVLTIWLLRAA